MLHMGKRTVASLARMGGWDTRLIFLPSCLKLNQLSMKEVVRHIEPLLADCDVIGISTMTMESAILCHLSQAIREKTGKPVIMGGIGAILDPEPCLKYADWICLTEAEGVLLPGLEAATGRYSRALPPGWLSRSSNGKYQISDLKENLDDFPPPDFDMLDDWIMGENLELVQVDRDMRKTVFSRFSHIKHADGSPVYTYVLMTTRGCPHKCTYCSNALFLDLFKGKGKVFRMRSAEYAVNEVVNVIRKYPYINFINIYDDTFTSRPDLEELTRLYSKEVGLPFCNMVSPTTINEKKADLLSKAGAVQFQMGVQTGSSRVLKTVYRRPGTRESILRATRILGRYAHRTLPRYDFILDNPYETAEDHRETIDLLSRISKPFRIQHFSLVFFRKTELYSRAKADGILTPEMTGEKKRMSKWANLHSFKLIDLCVIASPFVPACMLRVVAKKPVFTILNSTVLRRALLFLALTARRLIFKFKMGGTRFNDKK